ncbi:hypothetical protein BH20ACT6_BH20ACT6_00030 [soil metagenome]
MVFRLADLDGQLTGVRLWQQLGLPGGTPDFTRVDGGWELRLARPSAHRMEYLFALRDTDGHERTVVDPTNPVRVTGAFGDHSVLELPGYTAPRWLQVPPVPSTCSPLPVIGTAVGDVDVTVWAPADAEPAETLPLLVAHDGPELSSYAALDRFVGAGIATGELPRMRLALLAPGERDAWYSANADYARALSDQVLPAVRAAHPATAGVVGLGASLGGLALLHAEWSHPGTFAALCCQSGSFFTAETDPQERDFSGFGPVSGFVGRVLAAESAPTSVAVALTCGSAEENVHNNRVLAAKLSTLGLAVSYAESPDVHNYTGWRDVLDPHLAALLQRVWR